MAEKNFELKISKNTRVIQSEKKALVYNAFFGSGIFCHTDILKVFDSIDEGKTIHEIEQQYKLIDLESKISRFMEKGFIVNKDDSEENRPNFTCSSDAIKSGSLINKLRLNVSQACNMRCTYCYVDEKDQADTTAMMSWKTAKEAIRKFFNLLRQHNHKFCIIRFFGGEPLLNWSVIKQSLEHIQEQKQDISVTYILNTNGTIFSQEIAKTLSHNNVGLAVSVDGTGRQHDRVRKFKSGKPTYKIIIKNIESYLKAGCTLGIETTIGNHNIEGLNNMIDQIALWNYTYKTTIPLSFQHMTIVDKTKIDTTPIKEKIRNLTALLDYAGKKNVKADTGMIHFPINALMGQRTIGRYCRAMGGELCVYPNGDIFPCGALNIRLGSINNLKSVFKTKMYHDLANRAAGNIQACEGCDIEAFCAGGCAADAFSANGSINKPTTNCDLEKALFKKLVKRQVLTLVGS